jgi:hypothetical protein
MASRNSSFVEPIKRLPQRFSRSEGCLVAMIMDLVFLMQHHGVKQQSMVVYAAPSNRNGGVTGEDIQRNPDPFDLFRGL